MQPREPRVVDAQLHPGEHELDRLTRTEGAPEDLPRPGVVECRLEASLRGPGRQRRDRDTPLVEDAEEVREPAAPFAEEVPLRYADTLERQGVGVGGMPPDLVVRGSHREPRRAARHDDRRDLLAVAAHSGDGGHGHEPGHRGAGVRDELLRPVDHPLPVLEPCRRARAAGIRPRLGFRESEPGKSTPGEEVREQFVSLRVGAEAVDGHRAEAHPRLERDGDRLVDAGERLDRKPQRDVVAALPADLFGERQTEQAQLPHAGDHIEWQGLRAVGLIRPWGDHGLGEVPHQGGQFALLLGESVGGQVQHGHDISFDARAVTIRSRVAARVGERRRGWVSVP